MKKNNRWIFILLLVIIAIISSLWGYREFHKLNLPKKIVVIPKVIDERNDFWSLLLDGTEVGAKEYGVNMEIMAPTSEEDYERQMELIDIAIKRQPDAILLAPISYKEMTGSLEKIKEAGIKLVLIDSSVDVKIEDVLISTDNYQAGYEMGRFLRKCMPDNPVIGVIEHVKGASTAMQREAGFLSGIGKEYQNNIKGIVFCDSNYEKSYSLTMGLLEKNPNLNVLVGLNEYSTVGAARAVIDSGLEKQITMIGFDSSLEEIEYLEKGILEAIVIQKPFHMGYLGIQTAVNLLNGQEVESYVDSGQVVITKDTIYTEENQKLLFPFHS